MLTSASIRDFWISFITASTSFLSRKIAFDIFFIPPFRAEPILSSTMFLEEGVELISFGFWG